MTMAVMSNNPARGDDVDANANALKCTTSFGQATQVLTITHGGNALTFPIDTHKTETLTSSAKLHRHCHQGGTHTCNCIC